MFLFLDASNSAADFLHPLRQNNSQVPNLLRPNDLARLQILCFLLCRQTHHPRHRIKFYIHISCSFLHFICYTTPKSTIFSPLRPNLLRSKWDCLLLLKHTKISCFDYSKQSFFPSIAGTFQRCDCSSRPCSINPQDISINCKRRRIFSVAFNPTSLYLPALYTPCFFASAISPYSISFALFKATITSGMATSWVTIPGSATVKEAEIHACRE